MVKNLAVFDIETTGLDKMKDHIIQFSGIKINPTTNKVISEIDYLIEPRGDYKIQIQAYLKHHIKPSMLVGKPHFDELIDKIIDWFEDCDILTYNGLVFDIPFIEHHMNKYGKTLSIKDRKVYDSYRIECRNNSHHLGDVYKRLVGQSMEERGLKEHDSLSDVKATYRIFLEQGKMWGNSFEPENIVSIDGFVQMMNFMDNGMTLCFTNGKYKNLPVNYIKKIDKNYIDWVLDNPMFNKDTKEAIKEC